MSNPLERAEKVSAGKAEKWIVAVGPDTRYRTTLIATLFELKIGEVIDRAIICYSNLLKVQETMEARFPKDLEAPPLRPNRAGRPVSLATFHQHKDFMKDRIGQDIKLNRELEARREEPQ